MVPWIAGHIISPALERVLRRRTFRFYRELMKSQWWSLEKLRGHQPEKPRSPPSAGTMERRVHRAIVAKVNAAFALWRSMYVSGAIGHRVFSGGSAL